MARIRRLGWVLPVASTVVAAVRSAPARGYVLSAVLAVLWVGGWLLSRATIRVTPEAISVPFKRRIPWSSVAHVNRPGRFDEQVTVTLRDGKEKPVLLPVELAEDLARIGGVRLGAQGPK